MPERANPAHLERRFGVTVGAAADFADVDEAEAWRRADEIRDKVKAVLSEYGISRGDPLVNVWSTGGGPILD